MRIKDFKCKCGTEDRFSFVERKDGKVAIYCGYCGRWYKWANKDERRLMNMRKENE